MHIIKLNFFYNYKYTKYISLMSKFQYQISFFRHGGFYFNPNAWDRILQFLGIGKYYEHWRIGKIYVRSDLKFGPSFLIHWWDHSDSHYMVKQNFRINTFYRLIKKTAKSITFCPILCVHEKDVKNGMELFGTHCNYRFSDDNANRNPIGKKIILKNTPQIPEGYGLYEERHYYYKRTHHYTDKQWKRRPKNNFLRKKKPEKKTVSGRSGHSGRYGTTFGDILKLK
jgi:hypothetical protein